MTTWGRVIDGHVFQISDIDPATLFTTEECANWQVVPEYVFTGFHYLDNKWYSGAEYLAEMHRRNPPTEPEAPLLPEDQPGAVLEIEITEAGANYAPKSTIKTQFDNPPVDGEETGKHLVLTIQTNNAGNVASATVSFPGVGFAVGDTFSLKENYHITWDEDEPTYAVFTVTKVKD